ncbi:putative RNA-directed DNA polymerase [Tanacetum coccineum]
MLRLAFPPWRGVTFGVHTELLVEKDIRNESDEPCDDERVRKARISKGNDPSSLGESQPNVIPDKQESLPKRSSRKAAMPARINKFYESKSYAEAFADPRWIDVMNLGMEALNRNGTWLVTDLPNGRNSIGCKWVYKVKYKSNGEVERFKARLVSKGYNQKEGINFDETFSQVVRIVSVRCILAIFVKYN